MQIFFAERIRRSNRRHGLRLSVPDTPSFSHRLRKPRRTSITCRSLIPERAPTGTRTGSAVAAGHRGTHRIQLEGQPAQDVKLAMRRHRPGEKHWHGAVPAHAACISRSTSMRRRRGLEAVKDELITSRRSSRRSRRSSSQPPMSHTADGRRCRNEDGPAPHRAPLPPRCRVAACRSRR